MPNRNPSPRQSLVKDALDNHCESVIAYVKDNVPDNQDRDEAIKNYKQATMWANRALFN